MEDIVGEERKFLQWENGCGLAVSIAYVCHKRPLNQQENIFTLLNFSEHDTKPGVYQCYDIIFLNALFKFYKDV